MSRSEYSANLYLQQPVTLRYPSIPVGKRPLWVRILRRFGI